MDKNSCILIVEDSDDDYEACFTALTQDNNLANPIFRCGTGDEALDVLFARGKHANKPIEIPCLILLDLNPPGSDGHEVLSIIKSDPTLKLIPVIVMTSSQDESDIQSCYAAGANSYVVKPVNLEGFFTAVARLKEYWFQISLLPVNNTGGSQ